MIARVLRVPRRTPKELRVKGRGQQALMFEAAEQHASIDTRYTGWHRGCATHLATRCGGADEHQDSRRLTIEDVENYN